MTNESNIAERLKNLLGKRCLEITAEKKKSIFCKVEPKDYKSSIKDVVESLEARHVSTMTGLDTGKEIEVLAHLFGSGSEITIKTVLDHKKPEVDTIIDIIPGADFYEREIHDLLGVEFKGNPNMGRFILPEDWPKGVYPLRKDFKKMR